MDLLNGIGGKESVTRWRRRGDGETTQYACFLCFTRWATFCPGDSVSYTGCPSRPKQLPARTAIQCRAECIPNVRRRCCCRCCCCGFLPNLSMRWNGRLMSLCRPSTPLNPIMRVLNLSAGQGSRTNCHQYNHA